MMIRDVVIVLFYMVHRCIGAGFMFGDPNTHFLGCFKDVLHASQMQHTSFPDNTFTIAQCQSYCMLQRFSFALLQNGGYCCCSDTYGEYGVSMQCRKSCVAEPEVTCGGVLASSVYTSCPMGSFGQDCAHRCHCLNHRPCDLKTGRCPPGGCASGWEGKHCHFKVMPTRAQTLVTSENLIIDETELMTETRGSSAEPEYRETPTAPGRQWTNPRISDKVTKPVDVNNKITKSHSTRGDIPGSTTHPSHLPLTSAHISDDVIISGNQTSAQALSFEDWQEQTNDMRLRGYVIGLSAGAVNLIAVIALLIFTWNRSKKRAKTYKTGNISPKTPTNGGKNVSVKQTELSVTNPVYTIDIHKKTSGK